MSRSIAPYGSWRSPITAALIVADSVGLGAIDAGDGRLHWIESRPAESGRNALVRRDRSGAVRDVIAAPWSARSRVHEYGGGAFVAAQDVAYFVNDRDQRVYACRAGDVPTPLTAEGARRYADLVVDARRGRLIAVCEDHAGSVDHGRAPGRTLEPANTLVAIGLGSCGVAEILVAGHDFYASPRLSPDGAQLAWLAWRHP